MSIFKQIASMAVSSIKSPKGRKAARVAAGIFASSQERRVEGRERQRAQAKRKRVFDEVKSTLHDDADDRQGYLGDYQGRVVPTYEPRRDGDADPGEVVWAWVPYEEDHSKGKDRPVLVLARHGENLLALQLTSKDHDKDEEQERRAGRLWTDIGTGPWDAKRRPSEVRLNRVLQLRPAAVRREGARVSREVFERVAQEASQANNW